MGSAYGDAPDDRHKSFLVGSSCLNKERYFQFVFFHSSIVFLNSLCLQRYSETGASERCRTMKDDE